LRASFRPYQVKEAEAMAMELLVAGGWEAREVSDQLEDLRASLPEDASWIVELRDSTQRIASQMQGPLPQEATEPEPALQITPELPAERLLPAKPPF
jgi:hypothetical protein